MNKPFSILFMVFIYLNAHSQDLANTEWIKVYGEKQDGSKIISNDSTAPLSLYFLTDSVFIAISHEYIYKHLFSVNNSILTIDERPTFHIDSVDDAFLIVSQLNAKKSIDLGLNRYSFIKSDYLFDYLEHNDQLNMIGDSVVICDEQFSATYIGNVNKIFLREWPDNSKVQFAKGSFLIHSNGNIKNIQIDSAVKFSAKDIENLKNAINNTRGSWVLPPTPVPLYFKIPFSFECTFLANYFLSSFRLFPDFVHRGLVFKKKEERDRHYNKGVTSLKKGKFELAVPEFEQCIAIDSNDVDAYYNLAYSYHELGNNKAACELWKKLVEMGQKDGEKLYNQYCK